MKKNLYKICKIILLISISPFICNYLINKYAAYKYPAPGQFIKIDGENMHYLYTGQAHNTPLVVLIAGSGCSLLEWSIVQPQVSKFARVVSYDRKGLGWSTISSSPRTLEHLAQDLYQLLKTIPGPYILVGHSMAGIIIPELVNNHPDLDIKSVIMVDAIEGNIKNYFSSILQDPAPTWKMILKAYSSYLRLRNWISPKEYQYYGKISEIYKAFDPWTKKALSANFYAREFLGAYAETAEAYQNQPIFLYNIDKANSISNILIDKKIPVFIISSEINTKAQAEDSKDNNTFKRLQADLKKKYGNQVIAKRSDHFITRHAPQIIIDCIYKIIRRKDD